MIEVLRPSAHNSVLHAALICDTTRRANLQIQLLAWPATGAPSHWLLFEYETRDRRISSVEFPCVGGMHSMAVEVRLAPLRLSYL